MKITILILVISAFCESAFSASAYWCKPTTVAVSIPSFVPLNFGRMSFASTSDYSTGDVRVRNLESRRVVEFVLIIEFVDSQDRHVLTAPLFNSARSLDSWSPGVRFIGTWTFQHAGQHLESISPKGTATLLFQSPFISTQCPAHAYLRFARITFADEGEFLFSSDNLYLDPIIVGTHLLRDFKPTTELVRAKFTLDNQGRAINVEADARNNELQSKREQLLEWQFSPITSRTNQPGIIDVLVVFIDNDTPNEALFDHFVQRSDRRLLILTATRVPGRRADWNVRCSTENTGIASPLGRDGTH